MRMLITNGLRQTHNQVSAIGTTQLHADIAQSLKLTQGFGVDLRRAPRRSTWPDFVSVNAPRSSKVSATRNIQRDCAHNQGTVRMCCRGVHVLSCPAICRC